MITALIFTGHLFFILYIFTKKWQEDSLQSAFINLLLIVILFSVGWSISTMFVKLIIGPEGFGVYFDRDAISLTLLTIAEIFVFGVLFKDKTTEDDKGK